MSNHDLGDVVLSVLHAVQVGKYTAVSAAFLVFYDMALTLGDEVRLIWGIGRMWSRGKLLFFVIRYYTAISAIVNLCVIFSETSSKNANVGLESIMNLCNPQRDLGVSRPCNVWFQWQAVTILILLFCTEVVLQLRIYAIYGRSKKILILASSVFFLSFSAEIGLVVVDVIKAIEIPVSLPGTDFCANFSSWTHYWTVWVPPIVFETLLFALALFKGCESFSKQFKVEWSGAGMLHILVRDSILYFFVIFITYLTTLIIWLTNFILLEAPAPFALAMPAIMCSRLMLNVRKNHYLPSTSPSQVDDAFFELVFDGQLGESTESFELVESSP